jgi:chromosome partitioning protein
MGRIIALANQKGGVGKTTTTINLGAGLAEVGRKVLLVDFDPQGALSVGLGKNPMEMDTTIYNLIMGDKGASIDSVLIEISDGLSLLPSNIDLAAAEVLLVGEVAREQALQRVLEPLKRKFDYILIDCPPSLGLLTVNALTAADSVIIPVQCEYFAMRGMSLLLDTIQKVKGRLNPKLKVEGILATMYDRRTLHGQEVLARVEEAFGKKVYNTVVNRTIRFAEAPVVGQPILNYASNSRGAEAYRSLVREVTSK